MKFKQLRTRRFGNASLFLGSALFTLVMQSGPAVAANLFWNNSVPKNWDGGATTWNATAGLALPNVVWTNGSDANFQTPGGSTVTIVGATGPIANSISAASPLPGPSAWVITGGTIQMQGSGAISAGVANTLTIASGINGVAAGQGLSLTAGGGSVVISGAIGSNIGNVVSNAPSLTLSGVNAFSGGLSVQSGTTTLAGGSAVPNASAVDLSGSAAVIIAAAETIGNLSGTAGTTLNLGGTLTVTQTPAPVTPPFPPTHLTFAGTITGTGGLVKNGPASLGLTGNNTYGGQTIVNAGALLIGSSNSLGAVAGPPNTNNTVINSGGTVALSGGFSTGEDFTIVGAGDAAGGYLGAIHNLSGVNTIGPVGGGTGLITMTGVPATIHADAGSTLNINGGITSNVPFGNDTITFSTLTGALIDVNSVISGVVEEVVKTGLGTLDLTGQINLYNGIVTDLGDTHIVDGQILVDSNNNLGTGVGQAGGVEFNGAALALPTLHVINNNIDFGAANRYFTITGPIGQFNIDSGLTATIKNSELSFGSPGNILRKIGKGTLIIDASQPGIGFTSTINGTLDPDDGTLTVWGAGHSGVNPVAAPGCVPAAGTTTLVLKGLGEDPLALTPVIGTPTSGTINLGTVAHAFDNVVIQQTNNGTFNGTLNTTGDLYIRNGTGILTLGGNNSIDGNVHIAGTQLIVSNTGALGDWALTHDSRATFICGTTNIPAGDFAGPSSPGILSLTNNITLNERVTIINNGRLDNLSGNNVLNSELRVLFNGGLPFDIVSGPDDARIGATTGTLTLANGIFSDPASINLNGLATDTGTVIVAGQIQNTVVNVSLGNSANPTNTVQLLGLNAYTGQSILNGGNLIVGNNAALSSSQVLVNAPTNLDGTAGPLISLANNMALNANLTIGTSNSDLTLNGVLAGNGGINKTGTGMLILGAHNTYIGTTHVLAGTLGVGGSLNSFAVNVDSGAILITAPGGEVLPNGSTLTNAGTVNFLGGETIGTLNNTGTVNASGYLTTSALSGTGTINLGANTLTAESGTYSGTLVGVNGSLVKNGGGTLALSGNNNGLTGTATVNNGSLALQNSLGSSVVNVGALGTLSTSAAEQLANTAALTVSGTVTLGGAETIGSLNVNSASGVVNLGGTLTTTGLNGVGTINLGANTLAASTGIYSGTINGSGGLDKNSAGTLTLAGTNAFTGATNVNAGTLALQSALASTAVTVGATGTLSTSTSEQIANGATLTANGTVNLGGNETITTLNGAGTVNLGVGILTLQGGTFTGAVNGTGGLTKTDAATLTLSGANGYTGNTNVNGGTLALTGSLASSAVNVAFGGTLATSTAGNHLADTSALSNNGTVTLGVNETVGSYTSTGLLNGAGTLTASTYALNNGSVVNANLGTGIVTTNGLVTIANTTTGASAITVQTGTLTASGTFAATNINVDTLGTLNSNGVLAPAATLSVSGTANINAASTIGSLDVNAASGVVNLVTGNLTTTNLNGGGTINLNANTLTASSGAYSGTLMGTGGLTKANAGVLSLSGTNSFTGATNVNAGTLALHSALSSTAVNVLLGATLSTSASEQLADNVVLAANGTVNLGGNETIGTLNGAGTVNIGASTLTINNGGTWTGSILGTGLTYINGGTLTISPTGALNSDLISVKAGVTLDTTAANLLGDTSALNNNGTVTLGGNDTVASYTSTGLLNGVGTLTAATYTLNNGSVVNANLGTGIITSNGTVTIANASTLASAITVQSGTLTATGGTFAAANINVQTLATMNSSGTFLATNINVASGATLNASNLIANAATVTTSGTVNIISGPNTILNLNVNDASGLVKLTGGNLSITGGFNGVGTIDLGANTLSAASGSYSGEIKGTGNLTMTGPGLLTLAGSNSFTGTANVTGGTLIAQTALNASALNVSAGATYRNVGGLINPSVTINNNGVVTLFGNEQASTYTSTGTLNGTGLTGVAMFTAGTYNLNGGSVVGDHDAFGQLALGTGTINSNGAVALYANSAANATNVLSGTLSVGGTLGSANATVNIASGATLVELLQPSFGINANIVDSATVTNAGTLTLTDDELILHYTSGGAVVGNGLLNGTGTLTALDYALNDHSVVALGANLGTGAVTSNGTVILNGNSAANSVVVQTGILTVNNLLGSPGASISIAALATLVDNGNIVNDAAVTNNGTMTMGVSDTIGSYTSTGLLNGSGTLTAATYALNGGSNVLANLGTGALTTNGIVNISGSSLANSVEVQTGTLTIGSTLGSPFATVNIDSGARLVDNGNIVDSAILSNGGRLTLSANETVGTYTSGGIHVGDGLLDGTGTLQASTYNLGNHSVVSATTPLGTGTLNSTGTVILNSASAANTVNVNSGSLTINSTLGSAGATVGIAFGATLVDNGNIVDSAAVTNGGTLTLSANETIGSYTSTGLLNSSVVAPNPMPILTAATYALNGGTVVAASANLGNGILTSNGSVLLAGNSTAGTVNVNSGLLTSTGSLGVTGTQITVLGGAGLSTSGPLTFGLLQGNGTVTRSLLTNTTVVAPGIGSHNLGTLTLNGSYAGTGTLQIDIDGTPGHGVTSDVLVVSGNANLTGGTLKMVKSFSEMSCGDISQVISAGSYTGMVSLFDISEFTNLMLFDNGSGTVYGSGIAKNQNLSNISGLNANQIAVGQALSLDVLKPSNFINASKPLDAALLAVLGSCDAAGQSLNQLSPESYAGLSDYGLNVTRNYTRTAMGVAGPGAPSMVAPTPMAEAKGGIATSAKGSVPPPAPTPAAPGKTTVFAAYSHYDGGSESSNNGADYKLTSNGGIAGARHTINNFTFGGFVGIDDGEVTSAFVDANASGWVLGGFVSYLADEQHNIIVDGGLTYGKYDFDGTRNTLDGVANFSGVGSNVFDVFASVKGDVYKNDKLRLSPALSLHYLTSSVDSINETAAGTALSVGSMDEDALLAEIDLNLEYKVAPSVRLLGNIGYTHNFIDSNRGVSASFVNGGSAFSVTAPGMGQDILSVGAGASWNVTDAFTLGVNYRAAFGSDSKVSNSLGVSASYAF